MSKLAVAQVPPAFLDREQTLEKAVALIDEAAAADADMVVFPESFIPGYPAWIWRLRPGSDWDSSEALHARLLENAVDIDSGQLDSLRTAAKRHGVTVVCGLTERDARLSRSTLYNTSLIIGPDGGIINRHRKLMPTNPERMVWGFGDASGLRVVETPCGRTGTLMCWENYMPLARYALYAQGVEVYIAPTYDSGDGWIGTLQHIAREGGCWVLGAGAVLRAQDLPADFPDRDRLYPDAQEWINPGDSVVVAPGGAIVAGPMHNQIGILYAHTDNARVGIARRSMDIAGHYARPDIFTLQVDTRPHSSIEFK
jgi:nitrilase